MARAKLRSQTSKYMRLYRTDHPWTSFPLTWLYSRKSTAQYHHKIFCFSALRAAQVSRVSRKQNAFTGITLSIPAVDDESTSIRSRHELDSAHEEQQRCRMIWHAVVRPSRELELLYFSPLSAAVLHHHHRSIIIVHHHSARSRTSAKCTPSTLHLSTVLQTKPNLTLLKIISIQKRECKNSGIADMAAQCCTSRIFAFRVKYMYLCL